MLAEMLGLVSSDIALVLDADGTVQKVVLGSNDNEALRSASADWIGRSLQDTVTGETRKKVEELLADVSRSGVSRPRHVHHAGPLGQDISLTYTAVQLGSQGPLLAVGKDLRAVAAMQQRFIATQQEMERNYWKMRQAESRYRMLFQVANDAVLVIDPNTLKIADANDAAARLFGLTSEELVGKSPTIGIEPGYAPAVDGVLTTALAAGRSTEVRVHLAKGGQAARVSATPYITSGPSVLLLRTRLVLDQISHPAAESKLKALVDRTQDAIVITDHNGNILIGNPALISLFELNDEEAAAGRPLGDWLDTNDGSLAQTISELVQNGAVPLFIASLRTGKIKALPVEVSATLLPDGEGHCVGFIMRARNMPSNISPRQAADDGSTHSLH
jgi:transcriptional regulator PpsR